MQRNYSIWSEGKNVSLWHFEFNQVFFFAVFCSSAQHSWSNDNKNNKRMYCSPDRWFHIRIDSRSMMWSIEWFCVMISFFCLFANRIVLKVFKEFRIPNVHKQTNEWMLRVGVAWSGESVRVLTCVYQSQLIGIQIRFGFAVFKVNYSNLCDFNHHRSCVYSSLCSQFSLSHTSLWVWIAWN